MLRTGHHEPPRVGDLLVPLHLPDELGSPPVRCGADAATGWRRHGPVVRVGHGDGWVGYGLRTVDGPQWQAWLVGEPVPRTLAAGGWDDDLDPDRLVPALRGSFLLLARHKPSGGWHAWTDRFGTVHGYHGFVPATADQPAQAALGTFSPAVAALASDRELDWEALTGWCAFGFFPGDRTHLTDVRVLPPATHTAFAADGSVESRSRWWDWSHRPDRSRSYDATVDDYAEQFEAVLAEQVADASGGLAVPISGGLDSRSTVAGLTRAGERPDPALWAFSYGWSDRSDETAIGAELAAARGLPFERFTIGPYLFDQLDRVLDATEGMSDVSPPRQVGVVHQLAAHADELVAAHWGDVWLDDVHLHPERDLVDDVLWSLSKPGRVWLLDNVCRHQLPPGTLIEDLLRGFVTDGLHELDDIEDDEFRVKAFKTDHWSHRWTLASLRTYRGGLVPVLPYYDPDLADLFATIPSGWLAGRRLQLDHLRRTAPDLARVTWQATGADLFDAARPRLARLPGRALRAAKARRRPDPTAQRNWEVQFGGAADRARLHDHLLGDGVPLHGVVEPGPVAELLDRFAAEPTGANGYTVSMLFTLGAWLDRHG